MSDVEAEVATLREKMNVANNRISSLEGHKDALVGAISDLDKTLALLNANVHLLSEKDRARAKWFGWATMAFVGAFISTAAQFVLRGGLIP